MSGGGGWGKKKGLLSLDPDTRPNFPDEVDDADILQRSFNKEGQLVSPNDIAVPGSWIQFFVPAHDPTNKSETTPAAVFGSSARFGWMPTKANSIIPHFGALSIKGVFLESERGGAKLHSKLDMPNARVMIQPGTSESRDAK